MKLSFYFPPKPQSTTVSPLMIVEVNNNPRIKFEVVDYPGNYQFNA
jgi:hypothetical protein